MPPLATTVTRVRCSTGSRSQRLRRLPCQAWSSAYMPVSVEAHSRPSLKVDYYRLFWALSKETAGSSETMGDQRAYSVGNTGRGPRSDSYWKKLGLDPRSATGVG